MLSLICMVPIWAFFAIKFLNLILVFNVTNDFLNEELNPKKEQYYKFVDYF